MALMSEKRKEDNEPAVWRKALDDCHIKAVPADNAALDLINRLTLEPVTKDDVYTYSMALANDQYDRADERFPKEYLDRFAQTLPGKSVMPAHDYSQPPIGRFYDADVRKDATTDGYYLHAKAYMPADSPHVGAVKTGVSGHVSIGFQPDTRTCDIDGLDYDGYRRGPGVKDDAPICQHISGQTYDGKKCTLTYSGDMQKVEALEGSHVWLGCQHGATTMRGAFAPAHKAAYLDTLATKAGGTEDLMDEKEKAAAAEREKSLTAEIERLKSLAADGEAYRAHQKAEILRLHTSMDEAATGAAIVKALDCADAVTLDGVRKDVDKRHAAAFARGQAEVGGAITDAPAATLTVEQILARGTSRRGGY